MMAADDLGGAIQADDEDRIWYSIHAFFMFAGIVSRLLFPTGRENAARGAQLRNDLHVNEDSVLRLRQTRDHFEHIDAKLDEWSRSAGTLADSNITRDGLVVLEVDMDGKPIRRIARIREFDTMQMAVSFWGEYVWLRPVISEVSRLYDLTKLDDF
jgi:hypothetical protein